MPTSNCSVFHPWSKHVSAISRTAVYGPVCTVVWEGRSRETPPYPDWLVLLPRGGVVHKSLKSRTQTWRSRVHDGFRPRTKNRDQESGPRIGTKNLDQESRRGLWRHR